MEDMWSSTLQFLRARNTEWAGTAVVLEGGIDVESSLKADADINLVWRLDGLSFWGALRTEY
jgi:hypothetical protein